MPAGPVGILGGSFNPVHNGHLRLGLEAVEGLGLDRLDLMPAGEPPHKGGGGLLPFALRRRLCELAAAGADRPDLLRVSGLEGERTGPSYTWDTLDAYRRREPGRELFFVLGAGDLLTLPEWRRGRELVELAGLAVLPRQGAGLEQVRGFLREFWPGAEPCDPPRGPADTARAAWRFPSGTRLVYLDAPRLEISGTLVRRRWHAGRSLAGLVPESVLAELRARRADVDAAWAQS